MQDNIKTKKSDSHAALLFVNSDGSAFVYNNSSGNFAYDIGYDSEGNEIPLHLGGIERTNCTSVGNMCKQYSLYSDFYFQRIN